MKTKNELVIELRGVEFVNKGAELMLFAIVEQVKKQFPQAKFVLEDTARAPRKKHLENGFYTKTYKRKYKINIGFWLSLMPGTWLRENSYIRPSEIDIVFDGSGFAFGDQWGAKKAGQRLGDFIEGWRREGKKIIMLPQALGPFTNSDLISQMKTITANANLIFARDEISLDYIKQLSPQANNIFLKPDFTNLIKGIVPQDFDRNVNKIAIIPNSKMIETASEDNGGAYLSLLKSAVQKIQQRGGKPFFLIHESKMDVGIANQINQELSVPIPVISESDPLKVKGIIGACEAVITSRFHGLVSCLSQGTPCLATGWSHKYQMLLKDYSFSEGLVDVNVSDTGLDEKLDLILDPARASALSDKLKSEGVKQKDLSKSMWKMVFELIDPK